MKQDTIAGNLGAAPVLTLVWTLPKSTSKATILLKKHETFLLKLFINTFSLKYKHLSNNY